MTEPPPDRIEPADLPIIDLSGFVSGSDTDRQTIADQAIRACETSGFFYIVGHTIPERVFFEAQQVALAFFRGPSEIKSAVHISKVPHHRGYIGHHDVAPDVAKGGDIREAYKVALELDESDLDYQSGITLYGPNVWPLSPPGFREKIYHLYTRFLQLADRIFSLFAIGLHLSPDYFKALTHKPASVMNVNYYPATQSSGKSPVSGIGAHSDYEAFAMLWQDDIGGLQIESLQGEWQSVTPLPNALVINIGDLMSRWTNDRFRATRHRVLNTSGKERLSIACFGNTNYHAIIRCLPSCHDRHNPPRYPVVKSGEYLMNAIRRTYAYTAASQAPGTQSDDHSTD